MPKKTQKSFTETTVDIKELGMRLLLTDKVINSAHADAILEVVNRQRLHSFVSEMIVCGQKLFPDKDRQLHIERDASIKGFELVDVIKTIPDTRIGAIVARLEKEQWELLKAVIKINAIPWYTVLWAKLCRKPLVTLR